ncbi:hypothetical protein U1Q18_031701, partial [Sarracenia purpurea var. burkii]
MANQRGKIPTRGSLRDQVADKTKVLSSRFHVLCSPKADELEFAKQEPKSKEKGLSILKEADSIRKSLLRLNDLSEDETIVVRSVAKSIEDEVNVLRKGVPLDSKRLVALESRINYLKRSRSPIRMNPFWVDETGEVSVEATVSERGIPVEGVEKGRGPAGDVEQGRSPPNLSKGIEDKSENEIDLGKSVLKAASSSADLKNEAVSKAQSDSEVEGVGNGDSDDGESGEEDDDSSEESASMEEGEPGQGIEASNTENSTGQPTKNLEDFHDKGHAASMGHPLVEPYSPKSWANIVANDSLLKDKTGRSRLNNYPGSKLEFFPPKDPNFP